MTLVENHNHTPCLFVKTQIGRLASVQVRFPGEEPLGAEYEEKVGGLGALAIGRCPVTATLFQVRWGEGGQA